MRSNTSVMLFYVPFSLLFMSVVSSWSSQVFAEDSKAVDETSITVKRGALTQNDFEVVNGNAEVVGDPALGAKAAFTSWRKACAEWKKELRELNRENQILAMDCNAPSSAPEAGQTSYRSKATYQLRVRVKK